MSCDSKHNKNKWLKGKLCPSCGKGKLEKAPCHGNGHEHHVFCKTCKSSNF